ncbi:isoprenoid synthase domain-containing protein [Apiospora marii]|uniref:isoprenoid synthase domain-containing protein n=1 Tax=Apiospora marii TaxID=335849 RepID=UPI0031327661
MEAPPTYRLHTPVKAFAKAPQVSEVGRTERPSFDEVKETLAGRTLTVPDLRPLFQHWPQDVNPALGRLQQAVLSGLEKFALKPQHRESLIDANVAHFTAHCWPDADFDTLNFLAHLVLWAWVIEGYTDKLVADAAAALSFRAEAKDVWSSMLGLTDHHGPRDVSQESLQYPLVASFKPIAARLCQMFNRDSRQLLLDELFIYLGGTELEAKMRGTGKMPTFDRYMSMRASVNGSGFFLVVSGLHKLASVGNGDLGKCPRWAELKRIAVAINFLVNDLVSAKREFETGEYLNSVILRAHDLDSVDASVAECVARVKGLVQDFDHQAKVILADTPATGNARSAAAGAIDAMRSFNVGSLEWSLHVKRYGLEDHMLPDGSISLRLGQ